MTLRYLIGLLSILTALPATASDYPLSVRSCDRDVTFTQAPQRVVVHDVNMSAMLLHLGLRERIVGYTGFSARKHRDPWLDTALQGVPQLASRYPAIETLLAAEADLFFAGWNYGMQVGGPVTPSTLAPFAIPVYELSESCSWVMAQQWASLDDVYRDLGNLGRIFSVEPQADRVIASMRARIGEVQHRVGQARYMPRVFLYDSGEDRPTTSGRLGVPQALIEAAGGRNVMDDVAASWTEVNWESVVERDPEVILIVDYGPSSWQQKRDFLVRQPALKDVRAIRDQRFIVLTYLEVTPSVENAVAIEKLADALHPPLLQGAAR
ncbi:MULTISPECIES: ABC transporter substrate-binding protein [Pseudomonas]|uniref:ABC transporter substrate-binding protein n=1 Tax=Pseudomonas capeferrum TaxID=1495066 RepID=A0ABY7R3G1_9PSED|nr:MULTISPECIES: ABC transporter substrate-binding protein [Pseudomonas]MUT52629.1 ABC transporter substrate-binding protein [Pseudomonas sp. TDA1]WCH98279.1 ABC transporter substrate-binding protein [Pseudomonas capeferrum]